MQNAQFDVAEIQFSVILLDKLKLTKVIKIWLCLPLSAFHIWLPHLLSCTISFLLHLSLVIQMKIV